MKSKKAMSMEVLVGVVILSLTLVMMIAVSVRLGLISGDSANAECATSVSAARKAAQLGGESQLIGCSTQLRSTDNLGEKEFNEKFLEDLSWCDRSFATGRNHFSLVEDDGTFCHLCAFYSVNEPTLIDMSGDEETEDDERLQNFLSGFAQVTGDNINTAEFGVEDDFGIVYFESSDYDNKLKSLIDTQDEAIGYGLAAPIAIAAVVAYVTTLPVSATATVIVAAGAATTAFVVSPFITADDIKGSVLIIPYKPDWFAANGCQVVRQEN